MAITKDKTGQTARDYFRTEYSNNGMIASLKVCVFFCCVGEGEAFSAGGDMKGVQKWVSDWRFEVARHNYRKMVVMDALIASFKVFLFNLIIFFSAIFNLVKGVASIFFFFFVLFLCFFLPSASFQFNFNFFFAISSIF